MRMKVCLFCFCRQDTAKGSRVAERLASATTLVISHQVLVEVGSNLLKKGGLTEPQIRERLTDMLASARLVAVDGPVALAAFPRLAFSGTHAIMAIAQERKHR